MPQGWRWELGAGQRGIAGVVDGLPVLAEGSEHGRGRGLRGGERQLSGLLDR